jgi:hypothetical protein
MNFSKLIPALLFFLTVGYNSSSQNKKATTSDGVKVILKTDGTWSYVEKSPKLENLNLEYSEKPYYVENGILSDFEKAKAEIVSKVEGFGLGGTKTFLTILSGKSDVRFAKDEVPKIIVKFDGKDDPEDYFIVMKAMKYTDVRKYLLSSRSMSGGARKTDENEVSFEMKKIKDNLYEITLDELSKGEYALIPQDDIEYTPGASVKVYCFAVDE